MIDLFLPHTAYKNLELVRVRTLIFILLATLIPFSLRTCYMFLDQSFYLGDLMNWIPSFVFLLLILLLLVAIKTGVNPKYPKSIFLSLLYPLFFYTNYWDNSLVSVVYFHLMILTIFNFVLIGSRAFFLAIAQWTLIILFHIYITQPENLFPVGATAEDFVSMFYLEMGFLFMYTVLTLGYYFRQVERLLQKHVSH